VLPDRMQSEEIYTSSQGGCHKHLRACGGCPLAGTLVDALARSVERLPLVTQSRLHSKLVDYVAGSSPKSVSLLTRKAGCLPVMTPNSAAKAATTVSIFTSRWSDPTCAENGVPLPT